MADLRPDPPGAAPFCASVALLALLFSVAAPAQEVAPAASAAPAAPAAPALPALPALPAAIERGGDPKDVADLRALQARVEALLARVLPATVSLPGAAGVIVDGGYVLTAAHVTRTAGRVLWITLHDGRRVRGVTLGADHRSDAGLIRIDGEGELPSRPMGKSSELRRGEWCLMLGQPSGQKQGRDAPARLGRVLVAPARGYVVSDCTMQSGDSGGPLFDMDGAVIGINSRINRSLAENMHVPVDAFRTAWDKLCAGEIIEAPRGRSGRGGRGGRQPPLGFGVTLDFGAAGPSVTEVAAGSPAVEVGVAVGDVIGKLGGRDITDRRSYARAMFRRAEGEEVVLVVQRGDETLELRVKLQREDR